jgi:cell wall-associated NlpC family hydrolase
MSAGDEHIFQRRLSMRTLLLTFCVWLLPSAAVATPFAVAREPVPVFNTAAAARVQALLTPDQCGLIRELEFIALPGTVFRIIATDPYDPAVAEVTSSDYQAPQGTRLYLSTALLEMTLDEPPARDRTLPAVTEIDRQLRSAVGLPYIWGGNWQAGVRSGNKRLFQGLDCSGLLYEVTNGATPRNTEQLVRFGKAVSIQGKGVEELLKVLQPLDLLVWQGHVIIVLDRVSAIESILDCKNKGGGVRITPLRQRLQQLMGQRKPADHWPDNKRGARVFVVRRWHPSIP